MPHSPPDGKDPVCGELGEPAGAGDDLLEPADEADGELRQMQIGARQHAARIDRALVELVPEFSRSYLQQLLAQGGVSLN
ncbi:RluA family pseudouridine synthase, partial [Verminephrobacter sp. Larva24]